MKIIFGALFKERSKTDFLQRLGIVSWECMILITIPMLNERWEKHDRAPALRHDGSGADARAHICGCSSSGAKRDWVTLSALYILAQASCLGVCISLTNEAPAHAISSTKRSNDYCVSALEIMYDLERQRSMSAGISVIEHPRVRWLQRWCLSKIWLDAREEEDGCEGIRLCGIKAWWHASITSYKYHITFTLPP